MVPVEQVMDCFPARYLTGHDKHREGMIMYSLQVFCYTFLLFLVTDIKLLGYQ